MKILVLGGTRFFGRRLVRHLLDDGHDVTVATRGNVVDGFGGVVRRVTVDRTDADAMSLAFRNAHYDVVYDQIGFNPRDAKIAVDTFGDRIKRFVFTSTQAVYDNSDTELTEADFNPMDYPVDLNASAYEYGEGKRQAEAYLFRHAPFEVAAVRVCMVISGDDDYTGRFDFHVEHVATERSMGVQEREYPITYVTAWEVADFLRFLGTKTHFTGAVNAGNSGYLSAQGLSREIGRILGKEPRFHVTNYVKTDPDYSPYAPLPKSLPVANHLAKSIGFEFQHIVPQLPGMVRQVMERLQLS